jgi:NhaP-type Na+/H+ and K+/H+ antiporter
VVSIFASKVSSRLGQPALLLFLLVVLANAESLVALRGVIEVSVA